MERRQSGGVTKERAAGKIDCPKLFSESWRFGGARRSARAKVLNESRARSGASARRARSGRAPPEDLLRHQHGAEENPFEAPGTRFVSVAPALPRVCVRTGATRSC